MTGKFSEFLTIALGISLIFALGVFAGWGGWTPPECKEVVR